MPKVPPVLPFSKGGELLGDSHPEYQIARIAYEKNWKVKPSRFDKILLSLCSDFRTQEEVREAEFLVDGKIAGLVMAYEVSPFKRPGPH